jgi:hypothetical protein
MKRIFIITIFLIYPFSNFAAITAKVIKYKGDVLYNGKQVSNTTILEQNGLVEVKSKSYLKIKVEQYNSEFSIAANSTLRIDLKKNDKDSPFTLLDGLLRWVTKGEAELKGFIRTDSASLAVRGTDFLVVVTKLLGETEVYCFKGKVLFQNRKDRGDKGIVKKNDWGGIGGRFSPKVGKLVPMSEKQITHVKTLLE